MWIAIFFTLVPLWAQPELRTESQGGVIRAVLVHADSQRAVMDEDPAGPGEAPHWLRSFSGHTDHRHGGIGKGSRVCRATAAGSPAQIPAQPLLVYFSGASRVESDLPGVPPNTAVTNRTIGFGSQSFFPSGINASDPGPFRELYLFDLANPCTQGRQPANRNQSGIVFFPGSAPLYHNGVLVGGLGVSGDGVEQDDYVTAGGVVGFESPPDQRADRVFIDGVRLPYWRFPRNPEQ